MELSSELVVYKCPLGTRSGHAEARRRALGRHPGGLGGGVALTWQRPGCPWGAVPGSFITARWSLNLGSVPALLTAAEWNPDDVPGPARHPTRPLLRARWPLPHWWAMVSAKGHQLGHGPKVSWES